MTNTVRVRFAPSPTGGLHLGGVRTVLYNYLFAKKNNGKFILRIEDTDQTRYVPGAEEYIFDCLRWCGLEPDESVIHGGEFAPYRQSERKALYKEYAVQLIEQGKAYYAFDTPEEIEAMRESLRNSGSSSLQYDKHIRLKMKNSLSLSADETQALLAANTPHVIRIKISDEDAVTLNDLVRGEVTFDMNVVDDKVLLKADGMPTYHLAVVVDDYLMKITHAFRGEEWLSSAPVHILLWKHLFGLEHMPQWAHLPLILKPDGNGKLSKRDGDRLGFPVYAMDWKDPNSGEITNGFKERGFLPEAFLNILALLGWNDGTEKEIFSLEELIQAFSIERIHKGGAKFDFEKAKWFNHEWIKASSAERLTPEVKRILEDHQIAINNINYLQQVIDLVKERCTVLTDFYEQAAFFFQTPTSIDASAVKAKWNEDKALFFSEWKNELGKIEDWNTAVIEESFKALATAKNIKPGELQLPFRVMLVGGKFGPPVFAIAGMVGKAETIKRIDQGILAFNA